MYKVGDKLKAKGFGRNGTHYIGDIYFHDGVKQNVAVIYDLVGGQVEHRIVSDIQLYWALIKFKPPKDEIEWLDRVKENFKNG